MSVSIKPGRTAFTLMPRLATSFDNPSVKVSIAPFEAAYSINSLGEPIRKPQGHIYYCSSLTAAERTHTLNGFARTKTAKYVYRKNPL